MLDFSASTYKKILEVAIKCNIVANCREYPSLLLNRQRLRFQRVRSSLEEKFSNPDLSCGLYVHFPFCRSRCFFCKYYSELFNNESIFDKYLESLTKEIKLYQIDFSKVKLDNLFLGGGTPTLLDGRHMEKYLDTIYKFFKFKKNAQITIEGTPESLDEQKLKIYKNLGINRISIGLQSANDSILKRIGRIHTVKDVYKAFMIVRKIGIKYIGTEVIWGLPGESLKTYQNTIKHLIRLSPDFIEGYLLTTGGRVKIERFYPAGLSLDNIVTLFKEKLVSNGYRIYYCSNFLGFIKKGASRLKVMNQNTDRFYNYYTNVLGIGSGASSHFNDLRYKIISDSKIYMKYLANLVFPPLDGIEISEDDYKRHYIILQIGFYRSINKKRYKELFGKDLADDFPKEVTYLKNKKIIIETPNHYKWRLGEYEMGHKSFFMHIIQYWYNPRYLHQIIRKYL